MAHRIEAAVLDFLGQYRDPAKVRELLAANYTKADRRQEHELARVDDGLASFADIDTSEELARLNAVAAP